MSLKITILIVDDCAADAELLAHELLRNNIAVDWTRVETKEQFVAQLKATPDLIIADYRLPEFSGLEVLRILRYSQLDIPCIVVSGSISDEDAAETILLGATDYLLKDRLSRLGAAVLSAIDSKNARKDQQTTQQALVESQRLYRKTIEGTSDLIIEFDRQGTLLFVNHMVSKVFDLPPLNFIGRQFTDFIHPEDRRKTEASLQQWSQGYLTNVKFENRLSNQAGQVFHVAWNISLHYSNDGDFRSFSAIGRDVTDRQQRENELLVIAKMAAALRPASNRAEMLPIILSSMLDLLPIKATCLLSRSLVTGRAEIHNAGGPCSAKQLCLEENSLLLAALDSGKGLRNFTMANADPSVSADQAIINSLPLALNDQTICMLCVCSDHPLPDNVYRLFSAIADISATAIQRSSLHEQTQRQLERLYALRNIDLAITGSLDHAQTLQILLEQIVNQLKVDAAEVLLYRPHLDKLEFGAQRGFRRRQNIANPINLGEGLAGLTAMERKVKYLAELSTVKEQLTRPELISIEGFVSYYGIPLIARGELKGVLEIFHRSPLAPDPEWVETLDALSIQAAIAIDNANLFENLQRSNRELELAYDKTIEGWSKALDLRDEETEGHSLRVMEMTLRLATEFGLSDEELVHVRRGALLHDIGKMGVPDSILLKPGKLNDDEWTIMRRHPKYAYELLSPISYLRPAIQIPYNHHEKWDGSGYPRGLKGEQIPLAARIFAVIDVWDALTSARPYRPAWCTEKAVTYIIEESGRQFDPEVVAAFLKFVEARQSA